MSEDTRNKVFTALLCTVVGFLAALIGSTDLRAQRGRFLAIGLSLVVWLTVFTAIAAGLIPFSNVETTFYIWIGAVSSVLLRIAYTGLVRTPKEHL